MLTSIVLENFKAFGERAVIPLAPITLIYGPNSAGKSTILQSLNLLKQSMENRDSQALLLPRTDGGFVDLGSFSELLFNHDTSRTLKIGLTFAPGRAKAGAYRAREENSPDRPVGIQLAFARESRTAELALTGFELYGNHPDDCIAKFKSTIQSQSREGYFRSHFMGMHRPDQTVAMFDGWGIGADRFWRDYFTRELGSKANIRAQIDEHLARLAELERHSELNKEQDASAGYGELRISAERNRIKQFVEIVKSNDPVLYCQWARKTIGKLQVALDGFTPVGYQASSNDVASDWRWYRTPKLHEWPSILNPEEIIGFLTQVLGEKLQNSLKGLFPLGPFRRPPARWYLFTGTTPRNVGPQGNLLPDLLFRKRDLMDQTNSWLKRLDLGYELEVNSLGANTPDLFELRLIDIRRNQKGVSVGLPDVGFGVSQILPLIVQSLIAFDQTITVEQPEVHIHPKLQADLGSLFAECVRGGKGNQFLIETHSEHLALRIQKLVRLKKLRPSDVSIIYVQRGANGSSVLPIGLDQDGDFTSDFPGGFFPERLNELI